MFHVKQFVKVIFQDGSRRKSVVGEIKHDGENYILFNVGNKPYTLFKDTDYLQFISGTVLQQCYVLQAYYMEETIYGSLERSGDIIA